MKELIERLKAAEEGSRELDAAIYASTLPTTGTDADGFECPDGAHFEHEAGDDGSVCTYVVFASGRGLRIARDPAPAYTTSLDAALPGERIRFSMMLGDGRWEAQALDEHGDYHTAEAATEALARRAAALTARQEMEDG